MLRRLFPKRTKPIRRALTIEHLEARDVPASLVAASYFDSALYQFNSDSGALEATLVAPNSSSLLQGISGIAIGPDHNLYISSQAGPTGSAANSIVRFNYETRTLSTFISSAVLQQVAAANGEANFAPAGLTFGSDGNLYVVMNGGRGVAGDDGVVRFKMNNTANGLLYGNQATMVGTGSLYSEPTMLTFGVGADAGSLYVSSGLTRTVVKITDAMGAAPGSSGFIAAGAGGLNYPSGLNWSPSGDLLVTDLGATSPNQGQILAFNSNGTFDSVFTGTGATGNLMYQFPASGIFGADGNFYTANLGPTYPQTFGGPGMSGSINKYDGAGGFISTLVSSSAIPPGLASTGFAASQLVFFGTTPTVPPTSPPTAPSGSQIAISGPTNGTTAILTPNASGLYPTKPTASNFINPFAGFAVTVQTATGDIDKDGVDDYVVATGPGTPTLVAVINGADPFVYLVAPFSPFPGSETFAGGAFVASGDFDNDGFFDFAVAPDQGGGARITIWSMPPSGLVQRANFIAFSDPNFRGGARLAVGDVNGDGTDDLGVAAGVEGGPRVTIYDGANLYTLGNAPEPQKIANFFVFDGPDIQKLRNGAYLAIGDIDGDGFADVIAGAGPGGAPRVRILSGHLLSTDITGASTAPLADFFVAGNTTDRGGIRVAAKFADGDTKADLIVGSGNNQSSRIRTYAGSSFTSSAEPAPTQDFDPFGSVLPGGVFVG